MCPVTGKGHYITKLPSASFNPCQSLWHDHAWGQIQGNEDEVLFLKTQCSNSEVKQLNNILKN